MAETSADLLYQGGHPTSLPPTHNSMIIVL